GDEDVLGRDVSMDDLEGNSIRIPELVNGVKAGTDICRDAQRDVERKRRSHMPDVAIELADGLAVDELHRVIEDAAVFTDLQDPRDVLMIDLSRDARLIEEHVAELAIGAIARKDGLQSDQSLEPVLARHACEPDGAHTALREDAEQLVAVET